MLAHQQVYVIMVMCSFSEDWLAGFIWKGTFYVIGNSGDFRTKLKEAGQSLAFCLRICSMRLCVSIFPLN